MDSTRITRRKLGQIAGGLALARWPMHGAAGLTAQDVAKQIQEGLGGEWPETGADGFKAGNPASEVRGIATTGEATLDVLQRASKAGLNLVITYEPTFYGARDGAPAPAGRGRGFGAAGGAPGQGGGQAGAGGAQGQAPGGAQAQSPGRQAAMAGPGQAAPGGAPGAQAGAGGRGAAGAGGAAGGGRGTAISADDVVWKAKKDFIERNNMVVFRLRDHWRAAKQNDTVAGLVTSLGWESGHVPGEVVVCNIKPATLEETVAYIRKKLNMRGGLRSCGDPKSTVKRVWVYPGLLSMDTFQKYFDQQDLLVTGEIREWEALHYVHDTNTAGIKRSMITLGRVMSEEPGMRLCAGWLKGAVKGVKVEWISAGDPYWRAV